MQKNDSLAASKDSVESSSTQIAYRIALANAFTMNDKLFTTMEESFQLLGEVGGELKEQVRTKVDSRLREMNLITREEFEVTQLMLERALTRVTELEQKIDQLVQHDKNDSKQR